MNGVPMWVEIALAALALTLAVVLVAFLRRRRRANRQAQIQWDQAADVRQAEQPEHAPAELLLSMQSGTRFSHGQEVFVVAERLQLNVATPIYPVLYRLEDGGGPQRWLMVDALQEDASKAGLWTQVDFEPPLIASNWPCGFFRFEGQHFDRHDGRMGRVESWETDNIIRYHYYVQPGRATKLVLLYLTGVWATYWCQDLPVEEIQLVQD